MNSGEGRGGVSYRTRKSERRKDENSKERGEGEGASELEEGLGKERGLE